MKFVLRPSYLYSCAWRFNLNFLQRHRKKGSQEILPLSSLHHYMYSTVPLVSLLFLHIKPAPNVDFKWRWRRAWESAHCMYEKKGSLFTVVLAMLHYSTRTIQTFLVKNAWKNANKWCLCAWWSVCAWLYIYSHVGIHESLQVLC